MGIPIVYPKDTGPIFSNGLPSCDQSRDGIARHHDIRFRGAVADGHDRGSCSDLRGHRWGSQHLLWVSVPSVVV